MLKFGVVVVPATLWLSLALLPPLDGARSWRAALWLLGSLPGFFWGSLRGGVSLSWRLAQPRLALRPGWILVPTAAEGPARVGYAAALSLMPGTLAAGSLDGRLLIHRLDRKASRGASRPTVDLG